MEKSFLSLIKRHEILRTFFDYDGNGNIRQFVSQVELVKFSIDFVDLRVFNNKEQNLEKNLKNDLGSQAYQLSNTS